MQDNYKMQLLAKFEKILFMRFRATLNFRKFKVALNPMYRMFLNFAKSCVLSCFLNVNNFKKNFTVLFLKYKRLKLKLGVFLAGHSVAMVTYCVTKLIPTCSPPCIRLARGKFELTNQDSADGKNFSVLDVKLRSQERH